MAKALAEMTAAEVAASITEKQKSHRAEIKHLKAYLRCLPGGPELLAKADNPEQPKGRK